MAEILVVAYMGTTMEHKSTHLSDQSCTAIYIPLLA